MTAEDKIEVKKGLRGVYLDTTRSSFIDGEEGKLLYRGYNIHDLAEHSTFEETTYLLLHGSLPTTAQLEQFDAQLKTNRRLSDEVVQIIRLTREAHPMDVLRTAISSMSTVDRELSDLSPQATLRKGIRLTAAAPSVVAAHARMRDGKEAIAPDDNLSHAANFLYMLQGQIPDPQDARLIDKDLVLHAEHGVNASTFAARVAASTNADYYAAITSGLATLKGPLHGGAAEGVMQMALEIGSEDKAEEYVTRIISSGGRVMGFGHPVYKVVDPRAVHLRADATAVGKRKGEPVWYSILQAVTKAMEPYARKGVHPNVDLWSGASYHLLGIPDDLFVPIFALARITGWTVHVMEQYASKNVLRPKLLYDGPMGLDYVPIDRRS
jgi:citrate synthase